MRNRFAGELSTDAYGVLVDQTKIGRYHISNALAADTDGILEAVSRTGTKAWVASSCTVEAASDSGDTLTVKAPTMLGDAPNVLKIDLLTADDDVLHVYVDDASDDTIVIELAKTTAANNAAALIQTAIRALGTVAGIDVTSFTCTAAGNWDTAAKATGEAEPVDFENGVTGDVDIYEEDDLNQPPEPRNITATTDGTAADIGNVAVTVYGIDIDNQPIEEQLPYFTADAKGTATGTKAFKKVTKVAIPAHDGNGATTQIGFGKLIGLPYKLDNKFVQTALDGVFESLSPTINIDPDVLCKNTVQLAGADSMDGTKDVDIFMYL